MSFLSFVGPALGAASSLFGMFGNNDKQQQAPLGYQYQYSPQADQGAFGSANSIAGLGQIGQQLGQQAISNPWQSYGAQGAYNASQMGQGVANNVANYGNAQSQLGLSLVPYAQQIGQTAFDPQGDLYARNQFRNDQQTQAGLAARGLNMTPYGAGVANESNKNFNLDWENAQLQRQIQGGNALGSLINTAGSNVNYGQQLASTAPGLYQTASQYPYLTQQGYTNDAISGLNNSSQLTQNAFDDYMKYLTGGNSATQTAQYGTSVNNTAQNTNFNQNQTLGRNFGASLNGLANGNWNWLNSLRG